MTVVYYWLSHLYLGICFFCEDGIILQPLHRWQAGRATVTSSRSVVNVFQKVVLNMLHFIIVAWAKISPFSFMDYFVFLFKNIYNDSYSLPVGVLSPVKHLVSSLWLFLLFLSSSLFFSVSFQLYALLFLTPCFSHSLFLHTDTIYLVEHAGAAV